MWSLMYRRFFSLIKVIQTMSSPMPFIVIGGMMCLSSSVASALIMSGGEEEPTLPAGPSTPESKKYRYVRIAKTEDIADWGNRYINLHEVYVYDAAGTNVALNKTVTGHANFNPHYSNWLPKLVDGDDTSMAHTGSASQDATQPQKQYFQIDLGVETEIKSVKIVDRPGYGSRLDKVKVILMKTETPSTTDDVSSSALTTADANAGLVHTYDFGTNQWTHS
jgi:hypothetical protein